MLKVERGAKEKKCTWGSGIEEGRIVTGTIYITIIQTTNIYLHTRVYINIYMHMYMSMFLLSFQMVDMHHEL